MRNRIGLRMNIMLGLFGLWLLAVLVSLFNIGIFQRDEYLRRGDDIAVRQFFIPPQRGRIFDKKRTVLAWSERYFDLTVDAGAAESGEWPAIRESLAGVLPNIPEKPAAKDSSAKNIVLFRGVPVDALSQLKTPLGRFHSLRIQPRVERRVYDDPAVRRLIGEVANYDNCLTGVSGVEQQYDRTLSGVAEIYEITVDKYGNEILSTRKVLQKPRAGYPVVLPFTLEDILKANRE
ncbi:MAG: hypothetical protein PHI85_03795 [Victivallaceae bacterium]|nr:hypothetical protein [Victivallaceae bacterium]